MIAERLRGISIPCCRKVLYLQVTIDSHQNWRLAVNKLCKRNRCIVFVARSLFTSGRGCTLNVALRIRNAFTTARVLCGLSMPRLQPKHWAALETDRRAQHSLPPTFTEATCICSTPGKEARCLLECHRCPTREWDGAPTNGTSSSVVRPTLVGRPFHHIATNPWRSRSVYRRKEHSPPTAICHSPRNCCRVEPTADWAPSRFRRWIRARD
ncbi:hypothetical protein HPB50_017936 [Hyalomma asiaticum]|uniref:Uncharacterized protein n=1 Tax=Hyalomma asiaticum TaxID=266040 RepID=A0ACB7T3I4_HYAAI|nr:hypothetical protein HPB50_017936 [Hyalomma asiaticum]